MLPLVRKELRQNWRSFRLPALYLTLVFLALADPLMTRYMSQILQRFASGITIVVPPPSPAQAMSQFLGDVLEIGIFVIVAITMGAVAGEKASGLASFVLTKPVTRASYVGAKLVVLAAGVAVGVVGAAALAHAYTWTLLGAAEPAGVALATLCALTYAEFFLAITFAASMVVPNALAAGGVGLGALLASTVLGSIFARSAAGAYLPSSLVAGIAHFLNTPAAGRSAAAFLRPAAVAVALAVAFVACGYLRFRREPLA